MRHRAGGGDRWPELSRLGPGRRRLTGAPPLLVRSLREFGKPAPAEPPENYPVWPLWWAPIAFVHTRRAGGLLLNRIVRRGALD